MDVAEITALKSEQWVEAVAEGLLRENDVHSAPGLTGRDITEKALEWVRANDATMPVSENTFKNYLCNVAGQSESSITSGGRGTRDGYFISDAATAVSNPVAENRSPTSETERAKEKWMYPCLLSWMIGQKYRAKDTSAMRSAALGKWGNPDVTGLAIHSCLGSREIEINTIEAKLGLTNWQQDFFQAVSHRRFAHRTYFAFAVPIEASDKIPSDLRYYSERFGVGVLVASFEQDLYSRIANGSLSDEDKKLLDAADSTNVREVYSASPQNVSLKYQSIFCDAIGIDGDEELFRWGQGA